MTAERVESDSFQTNLLIFYGGTTVVLIQWDQSYFGVSWPCSKTWVAGQPGRVFGRQGGSHRVLDSTLVPLLWWAPAVNWTLPNNESESIPSMITLSELVIHAGPPIQFSCDLRSAHSNQVFPPQVTHEKIGHCHISLNMS